MIINERYYRHKKNSFILERKDEVFKVYPFNHTYMISNYGRVYCTRGYLVTPFISRNGYVECKIDEQNMLVHRLVMLTFAFTPKYKDLDGNRIDGVKTNNYIKNLEWCSRKQNIIHSIQSGLTRIGERHPNATHTNDEIKFICKLLEDGKSTKEISEILGIPYSKNLIKFISKIRCGYLWKSISKNYKL